MSHRRVSRLTLALSIPWMLALLLIPCLDPATSAAWPNQTVTVYPKAATPDRAPTRSGHASVKGTLTYYFNDNYGEKPDTGARIWLGAGAVPSIATTRDFADFTAHAYKMAKSDGEGNFRIAGLPAGRYTILVQSSHTNVTGTRRRSEHHREALPGDLQPGRDRRVRRQPRLRHHLELKGPT